MTCSSVSAAPPIPRPGGKSSTRSSGTWPSRSTTGPLRRGPTPRCGTPPSTTTGRTSPSTTAADSSLPGSTANPALDEFNTYDRPGGGGGRGALRRSGTPSSCAPPVGRRFRRAGDAARARPSPRPRAPAASRSACSRRVWPGALWRRRGAELSLRKLGPDRLGRRDALRMHGHRPALLPLHDAEFGAHPAATLVVLDAAIGKELGGTVLEVDLVEHLSQLAAIRGARALHRLLEDPDVRVGEDGVVAEPRLVGLGHEALLEIAQVLARPVGQAYDHPFQMLLACHLHQLGHRPVAAAAHEGHGARGDAALRELVEEELVVPHVGGLAHDGVGTAGADLLHEGSGVGQGWRVDLVGHDGQPKVLRHVRADGLHEADGAR